MAAGGDEHGADVAAPTAVDDENAPLLVPKNRFEVDEPKTALDFSTIAMEAGSLEEIDAFAGDIVRIKGKMRRICYAVVQEDDGIAPGVVSMDRTTRFNLRLRTSDMCTIKPVESINARAVQIALVDTADAEGIEGDLLTMVLRPFFEQYARDNESGRPLKKGDIFIVPFNMKNLHFIVMDVAAFDGEADWGVVAMGQPVPEEGPDPNTQLVLLPEPVAETEGLKQLTEVGYADIGGLRKQVNQIRESIELPLRMPKLFSTIGVKPPKGVLLSGPPGCGKTMIAKAIANEVGAFMFMINGPEIVAAVAGQSEQNLRDAFAQCAENAPAILFIDELDSIAPNREKVQDESMRRIVATLLTEMDGIKGSKQVMVLAATNRPNALDPALRRAGRFDTELTIPVPDRDARREILEIMTVRKGMKLRPFDKELEEREPGHPDNKDGVNLDAVADMTHGYVGADLASLCTKAGLHVVRQRASMLMDLDERDVPVEFLDQLYVNMQDFTDAARTITPSGMRDVQVQRPNVTFDDIGGLQQVKQELREMIEMPIKHASLFEDMGITPPKGALLYGPPGCGKTLMAKAIANECACNFIVVQGPQLLSKWFGESEENVRSIFDKARQSAPCVIFFDEIDSIATKRGRGAGGGPGDRVVNQLLTEMDGMGKRRNVFIVGATNFIDNLDGAVMRTGRLDQFIYIGLPDGAEGCRNVLDACLRKTAIDTSVNLDAIAAWCASKNLTGADIAGMCKKAVKYSVMDRIAADTAGQDVTSWALRPACIERAANETRPSVSQEELHRYEAERQLHEAALTTDTTAGEFAAKYTFAPDQVPEKQEFGTIDVPKEEEEAAAAEAGAAEGKDEEG